MLRLAPPVLEFNEAGDLLASWGGPGQGYDWPASNHGITVDYKGNVWIGGNGRTLPGATAASGAAGRGRGTGAESGVDESLMGAAGAVNDSFVLKFTQTGNF